jgi:hypothetical protein
MRIAFTIIHNGLRHLKHKDYYKTMLENFDKWIIVEGVSLPNGSTSWCKELPLEFHNDYNSNDGTSEFLTELLQEPKIIVHTNYDLCLKQHKPWESKDAQVNAAISYIKNGMGIKECFLWQVDIDEQWTKQQLEEAEQMLIQNGGKTGCFYCNYYVGPGQQALGDWGEGKHEPYRRLWDWKGELFISHEPPMLYGKNGPGLLLPQRFNHYAYYFEEDVKFKEVYYQGYAGLTDRWHKVQNNRSTIPVIELLGPNVWWSFTNTTIKYIDDSRRE